MHSAAKANKARYYSRCRFAATTNPTASCTARERRPARRSNASPSDTCMRTSSSWHPQERSYCRQPACGAGIATHKSQSHRAAQQLGDNMSACVRALQVCSDPATHPTEGRRAGSRSEGTRMHYTTLTFTDQTERNLGTALGQRITIEPATHSW